MKNSGIASAAPGATVYINTSNLELAASGTLKGGQVIQISSNFKWDGGDIGAADVGANVIATGPLHITGAAVSSMIDAILTIKGATNWDSTADIDMTNSTITNAGAFTANNNQKFADQAGGTMSLFDNLDDGQGHRGSFTKAASALATDFDVEARNEADFYFAENQINFTQNFEQSGANSTTHLDGGTMNLANLFDLGGGTLFGVGKISGSIRVEGTIDLGTAVGVLTVTGDYTQTATGTLKIKISGAGAGQYDVVSVGGKATLAGAVQVTLINGYKPLATDRFHVLTAGVSVTGNFSTVTPGWTSTPTATDDTLSSP